MIQEFTKNLADMAKLKQCMICGGDITEEQIDAKKVEYIKTKRGSEIFIHNQCFKQYSRRDKQ